jgi:hypothetical protein
MRALRIDFPPVCQYELTVFLYSHLLLVEQVFPFTRLQFNCTYCLIFTAWILPALVLIGRRCTGQRSAGQPLTLQTGPATNSEGWDCH